MNDEINQPPALSRPNSPALDSILGIHHNVLDHGFIRVVDYMGNDEAIVQAARVSYSTGTKTPSDDRSLIRYLTKHRHSTPLEMCSIKLHVKLPIFIARQWIRHRTAKTNETSARYSILDREFYLPAPADLAAQAKSNKQGRGESLNAEDAQTVLSILKSGSESSYEGYQALLNDAGDGSPADHEAPQLARELARMNLTLNYYTQWYWKIDLHNLLHFLSLRADPHAQLEIRKYADIICNIVQAWVPYAWEAFEDYRLKAVTFSRQELEVLKAMAGGYMADTREAAASANVEHSDRAFLRSLFDVYGVESTRDRAEFVQKLGLVLE